jgi:hypothetical protein
VPAALDAVPPGDIDSAGGAYTFATYAVVEPWVGLKRHFRHDASTFGRCPLDLGLDLDEA